MTVLHLLIGTATGILSGFGIGGGSLLMLYLTTFADVAQSVAGGINLLYFIGCAPAALWGHARRRRIRWTAVLWCTLAGIPAALLTATVGQRMDEDLLRRLFGAVLLVVGVREWKAGMHNK